MYSNKITEKQNLNTLDIDQNSIHEILEIINNEDSKIHYAVKEEIPKISNFIDDVVKCLKNNGRLFF